MFRKLSAIEIAEGALMANIAVVFQLLYKYVPFVGTFFALLVPVVFTILVLRRRLYAGIMSLVVAMFLIGIISGFGQLMFTLIECGAGLFLGFTMKRRFHYLPVILVGATGSALGLLASTFVSVLLIGPSLITSILFAMHKTYQAAFVFLNAAMPQLGLSAWWLHVEPAAQHVGSQIMQQWVLLLYIGDWLIAIPLVIIVYFITTFLVRLLGYDVRPFPDGRLNAIIQWFIRLILKIALLFGLRKHWASRQLIAEIRRQNIGLGRQKLTNER
jgi:uncharacterized protein YybS (DUF2232 family)